MEPVAAVQSRCFWPQTEAWSKPFVKVLALIDYALPSVPDAQQAMIKLEEASFKLTRS